MQIYRNWWVKPRVLVLREAHHRCFSLLRYHSFQFFSRRQILWLRAPRNEVELELSYRAIRKENIRLRGGLRRVKEDLENRTQLYVMKINSLLLSLPGVLRYFAAPLRGDSC